MKTLVKQPKATVGGSYSYGWQQMKKYFLHLFLIMLILVVADVPVGLGDYDFSDVLEHGLDEGIALAPSMILLQIVGFIYYLLIYPIFQYGASYLNLKAVRNQKFEVKEMFSGFNNYLNVVLAHLLVSAIVILGLVMLIVPGIILACRLAFVPYLVMDRDMDPIAAVEKSWQMTSGRSWTIFGTGILAIPIFLLGLIMVIVGAIFSSMWICTTFASLYYAVELNEQQALEEVKEV